MIQRRKIPAGKRGTHASGRPCSARQVGTITEDIPSLYLDLEAAEDRRKLSDAALFLRQYEDRLVVLDEIHRVPEIFSTPRGLIDQGRRRGPRTGRFLLLGSASIDLLRQSYESLAGRIAHVELGPLDVCLLERRYNPSLGDRRLSR